MSAETTFSVEIITLIPPIWSALFSADNGLVGRAFADGKVRGTINHLRDFGKGKHGQVDDSPYGGGAGMVLTLEPLHRAIEVARSRTAGPVILLGPRGKPFNQKISKELSQGPGMTLVCGRYEGFDERVRKYIDFELSAGDFVLSAGDPAALTIVDSVVRLLPGVL
ncbi:tRNA (guanosine(37)-N1)-methyltransferase TrmD, partial [Myxococcota bacterium]|nr:tRNA (guanosine(37)-N1)-methyltransferase TrmD [Myxococcota bacterium]